ncbi:MAG: dihydroxyacetone kinase subunit L [Erysipelotrichales bacterium]|nr:dihydroxyacetone kinase subunit L [Erysipelotrichales bacterium]
MNIERIKIGMEKIASTMAKSKMYLIELDQQHGDGDLGISMEAGFTAVNQFLKGSDITDLGMLFHKSADIFNEAAPSSMGTIITFIMKGMSKYLKGKENECTVKELGEAMLVGIENVKNKTGSDVGQKTILDSFVPAVYMLIDNSEDPNVFSYAASAAKEGSENTKNMKAVWGRAAYYGEDTMGVVDGGSVVGFLIFESLIK